LKPISVAILGMVVLASCGPSIPKVVFGVDPHWPPMEFLGDAKTPAGFGIDLVKAMAKEGGFNPEFRSETWESLFPSLEAGTCDAVVSSVMINGARRAKYDFSDPYLNAGQVLVVLKTRRLTGLADLRGRVGVQTGTVGADLAAKVLGPPGTLRTYDVIERAFDDLAAGRIDGVVVETPVAARYSLFDPRFSQTFKIQGPPLDEENYGLVVKKGNKALQASLNEALAKVKASGAWDELRARWLGEH